MGWADTNGELVDLLALSFDVALKAKVFVTPPGLSGRFVVLDFFSTLCGQ